jgi:hypothetical protein
MVNPHEIISLIPKASVWVEEQETFILANGIPLSEKQRLIASKIGIKNVDKIRLLQVLSIPEPEDSILKETNKVLGFISSDTLGITYQYGIYIRQDFWENESLIIHELTHILQYEKLGGIAEFLNQYIKECIYYGYEKSPLEMEARTMETKLKNQNLLKLIV